jgi:hypothetical protein
MILPCLIAWLASRINRHQTHVIRYLREENRILKAKRKGGRIPLTDTERRRLAVLAHPIDRKDLKDISIIATPDTLQRWYCRFVVHAPSRTPQSKPLGRPRVAEDIEQLVVRMATENLRWGYRRIQGALANLEYHVDHTTVRNILRRHHIDPAPIRDRAGMSWAQFVKLHLEVLEASSFFEARLSLCVRLWTAVIHLGHNLSGRGLQGLGVIRYCTMRVLARLAQHGHDLWARYFADLHRRCSSVFGRRRGARGGQLSPLRLLSSHPVSLQRQTRPMEQERHPPAAKHARLRVVTRRSHRGRSASQSHRVAMSRLGGCPRKPQLSSR